MLIFLFVAFIKSFYRVKCRKKSVKHIKQRRTSSKRVATAFTIILERDLSGNERNSYFVSVHITYFSFYSFLYIFSTAY